jgi:hypothetical protein
MRGSGQLQAVEKDHSGRGSTGASLENLVRRAEEQQFLLFCHARELFLPSGKVVTVSRQRY